MRVKGGLGPPGCLHPLLKVIYLLRIFSENWIIPGLERFNTFQNGSKRFKTVQWCPKPFARWETQRRRWAGLYRFLEIEVKTAFQWIERFKGIRLRDWAFALSSFWFILHQCCEVWSKRRSWMIWGCSMKAEPPGGFSPNILSYSPVALHSGVDCSAEHTLTSHN